MLFHELAYALESWVKALRDTIRDSGFRDGWSVLERRGRVQIQRTWRGPNNERQRKGISTQIKWERGCTSAVLSALETLQRGIDHGLTLDEAAALLFVDSADGRHQRMSVDWAEAVQKWRAFKISQGLMPRTFDKNDGMRLGHILKRVADLKPENGKAFARLAPFSPSGEEYKPRTVSRRGYVNSCCQFLSFCVEELGFDQKWAPPIDRTKLKGGKGVASQKDEQAPNAGKAIPFPEHGIKFLLDSMPDTTIGRRWRLAVGLIVCFGLRGVELKYLQLKENGELWCNYIKRNASGETKPRLLIGVDPEGMPGLSKQLIVEWSSGFTQLPPMGTTDADSSLAILTYLRRRPIWKQIVQNAKANGERISVYSLRHRYSKALDAKGFNSRTSSMLMGHSRHTFEVSYGDNGLSPEELQAQAAELL